MGVNKPPKEEMGELSIGGRRSTLAVVEGRGRGGAVGGGSGPGGECFVLISMPNSIPKRRNYGRLAL